MFICILNPRGGDNWEGYVAPSFVGFIHNRPPGSRRSGCSDRNEEWRHCKPTRFKMYSPRAVASTSGNRGATKIAMISPPFSGGGGG